MFNIGIYFTQQSKVVEVPCGANEVHIPCNYTTTDDSDILTPYSWIINSTTYYDEHSLPDGFEIRGTSLVVTDISQPGLSNTVFTCQVLRFSGSYPSPCNSTERRVIIKKCEGK